MKTFAAKAYREDKFQVGIRITCDCCEGRDLRSALLNLCLIPDIVPRTMQSELAIK